MKNLEFCKYGLNFTFCIDDTQRLLFMRAANGKGTPQYKPHRLFEAVEIHITGSDPDDLHGAKHTGGCEPYVLKYKAHSETDSSIVFELENEKISVCLHYDFYEGLRAVRSYCTLKNISSEDVGIEYISSLCLYGLEIDSVMLPHNSWCRENNWREYTMPQLGHSAVNRFSTKRTSVSNTGTWPTKEYLPMGCIKGNGSTVLWQIESSGSWNWEISDTFATGYYLKLSGPSEQENGWWKNLKPSEEIQSVAAVTVIVDGGFDDALWELTQYRRKFAYRSVNDLKLPVIFNDYNCCLRADPSTEKLIPVIDAAAAAGAEIFCMDAGWYADGSWWNTVGEWKVCERRFPNGMSEIFDRIRSKGMVAGIWLEPETMGINCPIMDRFDDECFFMRHGKRVIDHGRYHVDFRNKKIADFLSGVVDGLIDNYGLGYLKFDYNIDGGVGTEVAADSFGDGLVQYKKAFFDWVDGISKRHPGIIIENCASGGMRMDNEALKHFSLQSLTDSENFAVISNIAACAATSVLPEQAAVWCIPKQADTEGEIVCNMVSAMLCRIHLSGETAWLNERQTALVKEGIELYKSIRHLIPKMRPFYPLGLVKFEDDIKCSGYRFEKTAYICIENIGETEHFVELPIEVNNATVVYPKAYMGVDVKCSSNKLEVQIGKRTGALIRLDIK